ncbi:MAG: ATP-binding cassette domain-containing protein, partial [Anaerolineales bacterium]
MSDRLIDPSLTAEQRASSTPDTIISVRAASRVYLVGATRVAALKDVTLDVPKGVLGALRGRSGSGKTTLLNLIGGLDTPTTGEIFLFGQSLSQRSSAELARLRRQRIGFVFQSFAIMPNFSALENVELMLRIAGVRRERRSRAMRCLEIVGLGQWAHHRPWEMSG